MKFTISIPKTVIAYLMGAYAGAYLAVFVVLTIKGTKGTIASLVIGVLIFVLWLFIASNLGKSRAPVR